MNKHYVKPVIFRVKIILYSIVSSLLLVTPISWKEHLSSIRLEEGNQRFNEAAHTLNSILEQAMEYKELGLPDTMNVRLSNKTFWNRVGRFQGGLLFMLSIGFKVQHSASGDFVLALDPREINSTLITDVVKYLEHPWGYSTTVGCSQFSLDTEKGKESVKKEEQTQLKSIVPKFNPFKASFLTTNPDNPEHSTKIGARIHSKIKKIQASQEELEAGTIERNLMLFAPGYQTFKPESESDQSEEETAHSLEVVLQDMRSKEARHQLKFLTRAQRQLEELKKKRFYPYVLVRICFPDGFQVQGRFKAKENISVIHDTLLGIFSSDFQNQTLVLYKTPPKTVLNGDTSLEDFGLCPPGVKIHAEFSHDSGSNGNSSLKSMLSTLDMVHQSHKMKVLYENKGSEEDKRVDDFPIAVNLFDKY